MWFINAQGLRQAHAMFGIARRNLNDPFAALTSLVNQLDRRYFRGFEERFGDLREE